MKEILKSIIITIMIILPILMIVLLIYRINTYRYAIPVNNKNIQIIQEYLDKNNKKIKLDDGVKEIAVVSTGTLAYSEFEIVYYNGDVKNFIIEILEDEGLADYITDNSNNGNELSVFMVLFIISIINSIYWICNNGKNQRNIYYE